MKKVSLMNYVIVAIIFVITAILVLILRNIYLDRKIEEPTNDRLKILSEIKEDDLKSYLVENTDIVIYISHAKDEELRAFEETLNNYIKENDLAKQIVYLNLDEVSLAFYENIKNNYFSGNLKNSKLIEQANMLLVENSKVTKLMYEKEKAISLNDIQEFLEVNEVID